MLFAYDIEIFQNFFSVIFHNLEDQFDTKQFVIFEDRDDRQAIIQFLKTNPTLVGYNSLHFDDILLIALMENYSLTELYNLAQAIIKSEDDGQLSFEGGQIKALRNKPHPFKSLDLMQIASLDGRVGLKQVGVNLRHPRLQELPYNYDTLVTKDMVPKLLDYNFNDVQITVRLYQELIGQIKMRQFVSEKYGVDVMNASESGIANALLAQLYSKKIGVSVNNFRDGRTERGKSIKISDCIVPSIEFQTEEFNRYLTYLKKQKLPRLPSNKYRLELEPFEYKNMIYSFGIGGLHSQDEAGYFESTKDVMLMDADVSSFYPNIILINKLKPAHLDDKFLDIFRDMTEMRLKEKAAGNKEAAHSLKITINSVFGKMGFQNFWLYDPLQFFTVTISGQLYLLMLIEALTLNKVGVISANTDGVLCSVKDMDLYFDACRGWENGTGFELEFTQYRRYARRDVNSYVAQTDSGEIKTKGAFEYEVSLNKGYKYPIIPKALVDYFLRDISPEETIEQSNSIYDFMISQKASRKFEMVYINGKGEEKIQQTNRYIVATEGGLLVKRAEDKEIALCSDHLVLITNDVKSDDPNDYPLDKKYYTDEAYKIINKIRPPVTQLSLF